MRVDDAAAARPPPPAKAAGVAAIVMGATTQLGLLYLVRLQRTKAILKLRCVAFQRATSGLHQTPLSAIADTAKSVLLPSLLRRFCPLLTAKDTPWQFTGG